MDNAPSNKSMDVRAKQRLCYQSLLLNSAGLMAVSPQVISIVRRLSCYRASMLGLDRKSIELAPHRAEWKTLFESEANLLREAIGRYAAAIEHIGSTAVSGLVAKPIIDILIGVQKLEDAEKCIAPLTAIGYEYRGEQGIAGRFYFRKGNAEVSTHHLHMVEMTSDVWRNHLLFRDYLRQHPNAAQDYGKLKRELSVKYKNNRPAYTEAKATFIESILKKAVASL